jgi:hypothetical protein
VILSFPRYESSGAATYLFVNTFEIDREIRIFGKIFEIDSGFYCEAPDPGSASDSKSFFSIVT